MHFRVNVLISLFSTLLSPSELIKIETTDYCNKTLCQGDTLHTMCEHPDETPGPACLKIYSKPITESDKEELLELHNSRRERIASGKETNSKGGPLPSAANMGVFTWNDEIAKIAQRSALTCIYRHDKCRDLKMMYLGQNIASCSHSVGDKGPANLTALALIWYDTEVIHFSPDNIHNIDVTHEIGHFTQWAWAETYKLGCGTTSFWTESPTGWKNYLVCNYGPSGNWMGADMYIPGPPCSKCPNGTTCGGDPRYPSLCNSDNGEAPDSLGETLVYYAGQEAPLVWHWSVLVALAAAVRAAP